MGKMSSFLCNVDIDGKYLAIVVTGSLYFSSNSFIKPLSLPLYFSSNRSKVANFEGALEELKIRLAGIGVKAVDCEDCGDGFHPDDLIPYKYEPSVKLCENCNETRATEDES